MIVCVCMGVTDREIRAEAAQGRSLEEIFARTGAGSSCGSCKLMVARIAAAARTPAPALVRPADQDAA